MVDKILPTSLIILLIIPILPILNAEKDTEILVDLEDYEINADHQRSIRATITVTNYNPSHGHYFVEVIRNNPTSEKIGEKEIFVREQGNDIWGADIIFNFEKKLKPGDYSFWVKTEYGPSYGYSFYVYDNKTPLSVVTSPEFLYPDMTLPLERIIAKNTHIVDRSDFEITLEEIKVAQKIAFVVDLTNPQDRTQKVTTLVAVSDSTGNTVFLDWAEKILDPGKTGTQTINWIPEQSGKFLAQFSFWESVDNPTSLTANQKIEFEVLPSPESVCGEGTIYKEGQCVPICGEGTVFKDGKCVIEKTTLDTQQPQVIPVDQSDQVTKVGGCLIATATYGSELAPQVQQLREIRDDIVLGTNSGAAFMTAFNPFYYSFSPTIADLERQNPAFKELVKVTITPLLSSLSLLQYVNIDSEAEMLGYGIGVILLNFGMYVVAPIFVIFRLKSIIS